MDKVLITGGAGFMGSHVAAHVLKMGHEVTVLDDLSGGYEENVPAGARFVRGSILDEGLLDKLFSENRFDVVFHLAAYAAEGLSHFARGFNYQNNLVGSANIISCCIRFGCTRLVFTSSIAAYGSNQLPMREDLTPKPEDPYGIAKYAVEQDLACMQHLYGVDYTIFRPHNVYGENQNIGDPFRNVIGIFMRQILNAEPLTIFGDGSQTRAFSYIGDIAPILARAGWEERARNETFNVGADEAYSVKDLATAVCKAMGSEAKITYLPSRYEVQDAYADHSKVHAAFGAGDKTSLADGLARMAAWVQKTGQRQTRTLPAVKVWKKLPPNWEKTLLERGQKPG